jgi:tetratricopeptide (TPR) repeat protein
VDDLRGSSNSSSNNNDDNNNNNNNHNNRGTPSPGLLLNLPLDNEQLQQQHQQQHYHPQEQQQQQYHPPQQQQQHHHHHHHHHYHPPWNADDTSFSEAERFMSPASLPGVGSSWEQSSQSFDSGDNESSSRIVMRQRTASGGGGGSSRPSSRTSGFGAGSISEDRRKQFDPTTPTLIDEEEDNDDDDNDYDDDNNEEYRAVVVAEVEDAELSRLSVSLDELGIQQRYEDDPTAAMRRTPGASQMHQSAASTSSGTSSNNNMRENTNTRAVGAAAAAAAAAAAGAVAAAATQTTTTAGRNSSHSNSLADERLGFGLIMSTPVANTKNVNIINEEKRKSSLLWQAAGASSSSSPPASVATLSLLKDAPPLVGSAAASDIVEGASSSSPLRASLGPPAAATAGLQISTATTTTTREPAKGPFTFAPWQRAKSPAGSGGGGSSSSTNVNNAVGGVAAESNSRHGAFSPNTMTRLTEDIGQLLHEDSDDDDYAMEIPSVFRGEQYDAGESGGLHDFTSGGGGGGDDWAGSYVFDSNFNSRRMSSKNAVQRPGTNVKEGGARSRRRSSSNSNIGQGMTTNISACAFGGDGGDGTGAAAAMSSSYAAASAATAPSSFFPHAQAPKPTPRRIGNEIFEFGKAARDERASPQPVVSFSGAFAPPMKDVNFTSTTGSGAAAAATTGGGGSSFMMMRPVASAPAAQPPFGQPAFQQQQRHGGFQPPTSFGGGGGGPAASSGFQSQSFDPYQSLGVGGGGGGFHLGRYEMTPSPIMPAPGFPPFPPPGHHQQQFRATAQEFVPMSTRSPPPHQFIGVPPQWEQQQQHSQQQLHQQEPQQQHQHQPQPPLTQVRYDTMEQQGSWHSGMATTYSYSPSFSYGMPQQGYGDARGAMTPSPHLVHWPPPPPLGPPKSEPMYLIGPQGQGQVETMSVPPGYDAAPSTAPQPPAATSAAVAAAPPSSTATTPTTTPEPQYREAKKKESRRGHRRGKKKITRPEKPSAATTTAGSKKKNRGETATPVDAPTPTTEEGMMTLDDALVSASEDPVDVKRAELIESPSTKTAFKHFYRTFRGEERLSFQKAEEHALYALQDGSLPESVHWRVYLELADLAKRSNRYVEARRLYQKVCQLQPYASQGWLEYSKLEEECGFMNRVTNILHAGLEFCDYSESLLTRAVKHQEKLGNLDSAREILARLKHVGIDKVWRTVLEGALLEARAGNRDMSRRVLKYLMHHVPWYGPLYLEAFKLERDQGHPMDALQVVEWGLRALPRYGPLWFGAFRLYEEMDVDKEEYRLPETIQMIERAKTSISKELIWKVHLEAAQMLERTALAHITASESELEKYLEPVRHRLVLTILTCPDNLRWKVWLAAGRMELGVGKIDRARALFRRAHECVQRKSKSATLLDCARLEEFVGDTQLARAILCKARVEYGNDWKVWLESILIEIRNSDYRKALSIAMNALEIHTGTGRLWATLVQLSQIIGGDEAQNAALQRALSAVPKSGEVWCEGGRVHLNPFSCTFDLDRARRHLHFASKFTPQFGDSFIESLRVEILSQWLLPVADYIWKKTKSSFLRAGDHNLTKFVMDISLAIAVARRNESESSRALPETQYREIVGPIRKKLKVESLRSTIDLTDLRLACANADPNYGSLWSHCRRLPTDTPRRVIEHAAEDVADVLFKYSHVYLAAMVRYKAVLATCGAEKPKQADDAIETNDPQVLEWENLIDDKLRSAASLADIFNPVDPTTGLVLLASTVNGSVFVTGLSELNKEHSSVKSMGFSDRRRALFGTDALFP